MRPRGAALRAFRPIARASKAEKGRTYSFRPVANMHWRCRSNHLVWPVMRFARNRLCALLREGLEFDHENLLDGLLDLTIRVGTSTPNADPCGDYTWQLFRLADSRKPGAFTELDRKALKLTGFSTVPSSSPGSSPYGWILKSGEADLFLTYRTNAVRPTGVS